MGTVSSSDTVPINSFISAERDAVSPLLCSSGTPHAALTEQGSEIVSQLFLHAGDLAVDRVIEYLDICSLHPGGTGFKNTS